ncbi:MAG: hypothetical protein AB7S80_16465 [Rhizobiaceae bacterium]
MHTSSQDRPARAFARFIAPLRTAWGRSARISAAVSRDLSRGRLVNDGWPIRR